ncbi:hypothetical protein CsSME_00035712 [Camellia sinensis var. sinensis]
MVEDGKGEIESLEGMSRLVPSLTAERDDEIWKAALNTREFWGFIGIKLERYFDGPLDHLLKVVHIQFYQELGPLKITLTEKVILSNYKNTSKKA